MESVDIVTSENNFSPRKSAIVSCIESVQQEVAIIDKSDSEKCLSPTSDEIVLPTMRQCFVDPMHQTKQKIEDPTDSFVQQVGDMFDTSSANPSFDCWHGDPFDVITKDFSLMIDASLSSSRSSRVFIFDNLSEGKPWINRRKYITIRYPN